MEILYGIHPVEEALASRERAIQYVAVARDRHDAKVQRVIDACRAAGVSLRFLPREELSRLARGAPHQGVAAVVAERQYADLEDVLSHRRGERSFILVLDGVEDPHNLGAIIRTAEGAGADGIVIPERRAVGITATVAKAAAGAAEHMRIARVTNLARCLEEFKARNLWIFGLDQHAPQSYDAPDYNLDLAVVLGGEGAGLHDLIRKKCDFLVSLPMLGKIASLNVSVAAGVMMYEIARQRRQQQNSKQQARS
jgi:23S rRNA (guanosine2251-2'-O)-methyltransferase